MLALQELRIDNIRKQKRGLHFIMASVFIWIAVLLIHLSSLPIITKNLFTFCCSAPLIFLAYLLSLILKIDFQNKENPLSGLGLLISLNQLLYLLIAMWVYAAVPEKMLMVYAMIFGAHLLPYGWLYQSKCYYVFSVMIPFAVLLLGIYSSAVFISVFMLITEILFCILLIIENRKA
ncbi:MAG: hypothetical protein Q4C60_07390 [Eubacteriales bacterium]|nr:hypothetical protein [Eubacteriales bacterium]